MTKIFTQVDLETGKVLKERVKRGTMGMGRLSPDEEYISKGFLPLIEELPSKQAFQRVVFKEYKVDIGNNTVTKVLEAVDLDLAHIKKSAINRVDSDTESKILAIASRDKQRNLQAKYTQLLGKKLLSLVTEEEESTMVEIENIHSTIESIISEGNRLCELVNKSGTVEEVRELCTGLI